MATTTQAEIDLALASTYLPGLKALIQTTAILIFMHLLETHNFTFAQACIVSGSVLFADRLSFPSRILDANGMSCAVLIAYAANAARSELNDGLVLLHLIFDCFWSFTAIILQAQHLFPSEISLNVRYFIKSMAPLVFSFFLGAHAFIAFQEESVVAYYIRGCGFIIASVIATYSNLSQHVEIECISFSTTIQLFTPALYIDWHLCVLFLVCSVLISIGTLTKERNKHPVTPMCSVKTEKAMDDEVLLRFQQAKALQRRE
jgi:hypothetical protein